MSQNFGRKIKDLRIEKKITLDELAERVGSKKAYIWQLENKTPARPSGKLLLELADALDVSPDYLIDDEAEEPTVDHSADAFLRSVKGKGLTEREFKQLLQFADMLGRNDAEKES